MNVIQRNNVIVCGKGSVPIIFAHGFGCDQNMWRLVAPAFENDYKIILFDHVGAGHSDITAYSADKYSTLEGYAADMLDVIRSLELENVIFVGHSVAAMMGVLAAREAPHLFQKLILVAPSPYYINDNAYVGGFEKDQIDELLESLASNHLGWSMAMAPVIMGNPDRKELTDELSNSFCRTDPSIARQFARTTFLSDTRDVLKEVHTPSLILQCADDVIAPTQVGAYVHAAMPDSAIVYMKATGHCPNLSAPDETIAAIKAFL